ncbi:MAG TPA: hypothetical protein DEB35_06220 [Desulfuromonas sp.]|nr:hypothetical protein [Desulfuromonas sp.]
MILRQTVILPLLLLLSVPVGGNAADTPDPAVAAARLFAERFPELSAKTVQPSPIAGLFEVQLDNRIIYFAPESGLLLVGDLWAPHGENLTRKRMTEIMAAQAEIMAAKVAAIPLDKALKIGDGKHVVIEVTDPDCPYCRKLHDEMKKVLEKRKDTAFYVFLRPLPMHKDAFKKSEAILCDKAKALALLDDAMAGKTLPEPSCSTAKEQVEKNNALADSLEFRGTPTMVRGDGLVNSGYLPAEQLSAWIDGK